MVIQSRDDAIKASKYYTTPTRIFEVGEKVIFGHHDNSEILEVLEDNKFYFIRTWGVTSGRLSRKEKYESKLIVSWVEIYKLDSFNNATDFSTKGYAAFRPSFLNADIRSLIFHLYSGLDFDPPYQRPLVWSNTDKQLLLDSIFDNIDIGNFVLIEKDYNDPNFNWENGVFYEILDGKQRMSAIQEFYEDRFVYNGYRFSELSIKDKNYFMTYPIRFTSIKDPKDINKILEYFVRLNTFGKRVEAAHINKIKQMIGY